MSTSMSTRKYRDLILAQMDDDAVHNQAVERINGFLDRFENLLPEQLGEDFDAEMDKLVKEFISDYRDAEVAVFELLATSLSYRFVALIEARQRGGE